MRRSKTCVHVLKPVLPSIRSAATRTLSPAQRTLPSSRKATPSCAAIFTAPSSLSRNFPDEVCAITFNPWLRARVARTSSDRPSEKYTWSGLPLRFSNGSTATLLSILGAAALNHPRCQPNTPAAAATAAVPPAINRPRRVALGGAATGGGAKATRGCASRPASGSTARNTACIAASLMPPSMAPALID